MTTQNEALKEARTEYARARIGHHDLSRDPATPAGRLAESHARVKRAAQAVSAAIVMGCNPCPTCKQLPHGIEQPGRRGTFEYEIGCLACKPIDHDDGTKRDHRVRGGLMPSHAVDAWNGGPDFWLVSVDKSQTVPAIQPAPDPEPEEETP